MPASRTLLTLLAGGALSAGNSLLALLASGPLDAGNSLLALLAGSALWSSRPGAGSHAQGQNQQ